jgi:hypothetical protein
MWHYKQRFLVQLQTLIQLVRFLFYYPFRVIYNKFGFHLRLDLKILQVSSDVGIIYLPSSFRKSRASSDCSIVEENFKNACSDLTNLSSCDQNAVTTFVFDFTNSSVSDFFKGIKLNFN